MTKKLEELLDLPDSKEIIKQDQKKDKKDVVAQQNETLRDIAEFDKIAAALPAVKGLGEMADTELNDIAQKAMDMSYDGLMIETHIDPKSALSDKEQQITPLELEEILEKLVIRNFEIDNKEFKATLDQLRIQIDDLDIELLDVLKRRMDLVEKIGHHKNENDVTILQNNRWLEMLKSRVKYGEEKGLSEVFIQQLLKAIHQESIDKQNSVMNKK